MSEVVGMRRTLGDPLAAGYLAQAGASLLVLTTLLGYLSAGSKPLVEQQLPPVFAWFEFGVAALTVAAAWSVGTHHSRVGLGLSVAVMGLVIPLWAGLLAPAGGVALLAAAPFLVAGIAQVALRWPPDRTPSPALRSVYALVSAAALAQLLGYDPAGEPGCARVCASTPPLAAGLLDTRTAVAVSGILTVAAVAVAATAVLASIRRIPSLVMSGVLIALAVLALQSVLRWAVWTDTVAIITVLLALPFCAAAIVGAAVVITVIRAWGVRIAVGRLAAHLENFGGTTDVPGGVITEVHFAVPGVGWVDALGRPAVKRTPLRQQVTVSDPSGPKARLVLAPGRDVGDVARVLTPAIRLSLGNAQLAATTRARVADTQASRRRLVVASDAERQRIERDLHDGAQQRLVSALFYLSVARARLHGGPPELADTESAVRGALGRLRRLAHGAFPSLLTTHGLWVALDDLARGAVIPTTVTIEPFDVDDETARAIYAAVAESLSQAEREPRATNARLSVVRATDAIRVSVELDGVTRLLSASDHTDVGDRVAALGGTLTSAKTGRGAILEVVLPCAL